MYGTIKDHEKWNDIYVIVVNTGILQLSPKSLPRSPPQALKFFRGFVLKYPQKFIPPSLIIFPKEYENPFLSKCWGRGSGLPSFEATLWHSTSYATCHLKTRVEFIEKNFAKNLPLFEIPHSLLRNIVNFIYTWLNNFNKIFQQKDQNWTYQINGWGVHK